VEGDKEAFGFLYELFVEQILKYFLFRTSDIQIAEDLTETVFIKAWSHLPKFGKKDKGINFRAWLFRIAHNLLVDYYRKQKNESSLEEIYQKSDKSAPLLSKLEKTEEQVLLQKAISTLDERSQRVLISRFVIGMSHKDTSQSLGLTENNIRLIQFRALKKLRKILEITDE
jgi:RNA polymerase sigma-70 factor (ECF subfamily)